jgi:hypothetical protein
MTLSSIRVHEGPPIQLTDHSEQFMNKWQNHPQLARAPYQKKKRWYVDIYREYTSIIDLVQDHFSDLSLGKHLNPQVEQDFSVLNQEKLLRPELASIWTEILDPKYPWEV